MKTIKQKLVCSLVFMALIALGMPVHAQKGIPFITNYSLPVSMGAQNFRIIQGDNSMMYVLNQTGVFSFDGYSWERMPVPGQPLTISYIDKLFIGGDQTLGYFKKNLKGVNVYLPVEGCDTDFFYLFHHFNNTLFAVGIDGVYKVRRVEPYMVEPYYSERDSSQIITDLFNIGDKLFAIKNKKSIYQIHRQDAIPVATGLGPNEEFIFSFKHNDTQILGTSLNRIFSFDGSGIKPLYIKDQKYIDSNYLTGGISVNSKTIAFSTLIGGCIIASTGNGETQQIINYANGLPDDEITSMGKDNLGGLWLIHGMGISRVDLSIPISSYHHISGLKGNILSVAKGFRGLYVGTSDGLYRLVESTGNTPKSIAVSRQRVNPDVVKSSEDPIIPTAVGSSEQHDKAKKGIFSRIFGKERAEQAAVPDNQAVADKEPDIVTKLEVCKHSYGSVSANFNYEKIAGVTGKVSQLLSWNGNILAASSTGLYYVSLNQPSSIIGGTYIFCINPSIYNKNAIYIGAWEKLYLAEFQNNQWVAKTIIGLHNEKVTSAVEISATSLLVSTDYRIYRIDNVNTANPLATVISSGANSLVSPAIRKADSNYLVITPAQVYEYYQSGDSVGISSEFYRPGNYRVFYSNAEQSWLRTGQAWAGYPKNYVNSRIARYLGLLDRVSYVNYSDSNEVWVVNGYSQLYKLTPSKGNDTLASVNLYIKQVIDKAGNSLNTNYVKLEPTNNAFKIKLGAPFYLKEKAIEYQYKLEGVMSEWSDWGSTPEKDFPFFPPGNHILQFRARDAMGNVSETHEYPFSIKPPFYQSLWFYILAVALAIAILAALIRLKEQKLIREKQILEQKVKERTRTIEEQKNAIEQQHEELKIRNQEILQQKEEIEAQKDEITNQRDQIVSQNQDIIKSISYARRIQTAVMPSKEVTDSILNEYFILLKPRDIVSGDFFWMTKKNGKIIVTAADCTGHGVPGAFMSLMGITLLTEIVKNTEDIRPHSILNNLRTYLKKALSQVGRENEAKDGMDIALSVIDPSTNTLMFAGAYNPLYLIRNGELIEFKGDKMPVGVHINEKDTFTLHEVPLQKNDCIYMFSDGYVDQFGGDDNRKFMTKNFKKLLLDVSARDMKEQRTILDDTIDQWIGPYDQLDDILVLGIRV